MSALYLLPNLALFAVLCRMIAIKLHLERPALFVFLHAWFAYSLITQLAQHPALHLGVWLFGVPAVFLASKKLLAGSRLWPAPALALCAAGTLCGPVLSRWGTSTEMLAFTLSCWLGVTTGTIFLAASFRAEHPDRKLWRGVGGYFFVLGGGMQILAASAAAAGWFFLLPLATAAFLAPTPDALVNKERLAIAGGAYRRMTLSIARAASDVIAYPNDQAIKRSARWKGFERQSVSGSSSVEGTSTNTPIAPRMAPRKATTADPSPNFTPSVGWGANLSAKPRTTAMPAQETLATRRAASVRAAFMRGFSIRGR